MLCYFAETFCLFRVFINHYDAEYLKWNNPSSIFVTIHYRFRDIKTKFEVGEPV